MAGMTYTMTDTTKLSTAECYGIALCELGEEHKDVVALTADLAKSTKIGMFGEKFPVKFVICFKYHSVSSVIINEQRQMLKYTV